MEQLVEEMRGLCREYQECCVEVERSEEKRKVKQKLEELCRNASDKMDITEPELLIALLDAYEITRDEEMLQEVLDVVNKNIGSLEVSVQAVKLLAYCYYYVEEEECIVKAREMLKELKQRGENATEAEKVLEELGNL